VSAAPPGDTGDRPECGLALRDGALRVATVQNRREVGGITGLVGPPYRSGLFDRDQGISKAGNARVRAVAIQIAWGWLTFQPESALTQWYLRRFAHAGPDARKNGIVAVARRLVIDLWRYLDAASCPRGLS